MSKIRTLKDAYKCLKEMDENTAITKNALRRMVISGQLPCIKVGKKYLLDMDVLLECLKGTLPQKTISTIKKPYTNTPKRLDI